MLNSKRAFIELIKLLYVYTCTKNLDEYIESCNGLVLEFSEIKKFHLMPLDLLPTSFEDDILSSIKVEKWHTEKSRIAGILYLFLARTMYSSEVVTIFNSAEYKQGLEMCRVQFSYDQVCKWLANTDYNEQEVLDDYFYFILNPDVRSFSNQQEYSDYQTKIKTIGFPRFDRPENPIPVSLLAKIKCHYEKALLDYRNYIHKNYPKVENYFEGYNFEVRIYIATRFLDKPKGEIKLVYYYDNAGSNDVHVYPNYVDFIHRFYNYECIDSPITGGKYAGFNESKPVEDYEYQIKDIHLKLHDIFLNLADTSLLRAYLAFMLRVRMKRIDIKDEYTININDDLWYQDLDNSLDEEKFAIKIKTLSYTGFIFTKQPNNGILELLKKSSIEYYTMQDLGWEFYYNNCDELLHLYIKNHLEELEVEQSKALGFVKGNMLIERLKCCKRGKEHWNEYEILGKEIFDYLFSDDFQNYNSVLQSTTADGLCRRDLIINNTPYGSNSIWALFQNRYNSMLIVVDFKNYQESISTATLFAPTKYLNRHTGTFGIIFTREEISEAAQKEQLRLISTEEKVLLCFSDPDLLEMLEKKKAGNNVSCRVSEKYFSLIKKI